MAAVTTWTAAGPVVGTVLLSALSACGNFSAEVTSPTRPLSLILVPDGPQLQPKLELKTISLSALQGLTIAAPPVGFQLSYKDQTPHYGTLVPLSPTPSIHGFLVDMNSGNAVHLGAAKLLPGTCPGCVRRR